MMRVASATISFLSLFSRFDELSGRGRIAFGMKMDARHPRPTRLTSIFGSVYTQSGVHRLLAVGT